MLTVLNLFWSFCLIGFTSFGGLSMIPLINGEMVRHGWMTAAEVSDIVAIAEMTPGPLGLNCATFAGMRVAGPLGAFAANLGILTPTFTVCAAAAFCIERVRNSPALEHIMTGVRPVCLGIICAVLISLGRANYFSGGSLSLKAVLIGAVCLAVLLKWRWSVPRVIVLSALLGLLL